MTISPFLSRASMRIVVLSIKVNTKPRYAMESDVRCLQAYVTQSFHVVRGENRDNLYLALEASASPACQPRLSRRNIEVGTIPLNVSSLKWPILAREEQRNKSFH